MGFTPEQIKGRIKSVAKQNNADARTLMRIYMMERFLERLAQSEYRDNFIIKGGILVTAMIGVAHRSTMDIDTSMKNLNLSAEDQDMYEVLIKNLDMTNSDVSACSYVKEYNLDRGKIIGLHKIIPDPIVFIGKSAIYESVTRNEKSVEGYLWNKVWKREVIGNHLFREDIVMCEDSIFSWEVLKSVNRVCYCDLPMYHYRILTTSATRNSSLEKMSGALVSYELMLDDASLLPKDVVKNLAIQYLGWNYTIFQHMIREKERTSSLYEKVKSNCVCYQEYSCYLGLADRIGINAIAKHNYTCAKLSVQAVGIMQLIKKKICRIVKKQV